MAEERTPGGTVDGTDSTPIQRKSLTTLIKEWPLSRKIATGAVVAISVALFAVLIIQARTADYQLLYANLNENDAAPIVNWLKAQRIPYQLKNDGKNIWVPSNQLYETRLSLASNGLPNGGGVGFEIFDKQSFALTDYVQKVNYTRALQGELARTISSLAPVENARVHLALPDKSLFKSEEKAATASVILTLAPGRTLDKKQVQGIIHLVAGSVAGMDPANVTVIGSNGEILDSGKTDDKDKMLSVDMLHYQQEVEHRLEIQAQDLLDKTMGKDKAMVRVTANLDFAKVEKTQETFDPDEPVIRSEQLNQESTGGQQASGGIPGVQSNLQGNSGTPATTGEPQTSKTTRTTNYEISKTVSKIINPIGSITKLSVSILVADKITTPAQKDQPAKTEPRTAEELKSLQTMVSTALGLNPARGDQINIISMPFTEPSKDALIAGGVAQTNLLYNYLPAVKMALIPVMALLLYFFLLRPIIKTMKGEVEEHYKTVEQLEQERLEAQRAKEDQKEEEVVEIVEDSIISMRKEILKNPAPSAYIIKSWINEG
ncbi:MAG: flagellar basal-body MS-ring/collar protein FliF [Desulfocapsaceae bacterium]|nr:flagellar basal-body MS-ring/collar protein FliF [Desulfocapsaceae bacterium]